jgi:hypothetical protein
MSALNERANIVVEAGRGSKLRDACARRLLSLSWQQLIKMEHTNSGGSLEIPVTSVIFPNIPQVRV